MRAQFTHLYRVKNSKNYFFRIRGTFFEKLCHHPLGNGHFVASLRTEHLDEALWLSQFIKRKLQQEFTMFAERQFTQKIRVSAIQAKTISNISTTFNFGDEALRLELKRFLKECFNKHLENGKRMILLGVADVDTLSSLRTVTESVIRDAYQTDAITEIHPTVQRQALDVHAHTAKAINSKIDPYLEDALMNNRLIAELQKLHREHENYSPGLVAEKPDIDLRDGVEFLHLVQTLRDFTAFFRRKERVNTVKRSQHLQLSVCIENFCKSKFKEVGASAQQQYKKSFEVLCSILKPTFLVTELDRQAAMTVKNKVMELPSGRKIRGNETTLSVKSVNKYLTNYFTFCGWLMDSMQLISSNPFSNMQLSLKEAKHQAKRRQFSLSEIALLMSYSPSDIREASEFRDAAFWLPKISLYSGMRLNEAAGLKIRDVYVVNGIWVFDLSEHQLKNEHSKRLVPVHSKLIQLGVLEFYGKQKAASEFMLFPELQSASKLIGRDGLGTPVSKWFNRTVLPKIGVNKDAERDLGLLIDFHCTRTTVASYFKRHGVNSYVVKQILGHVDDDITFGVYGGNEQVSLQVLKDTIELLTY